MKELTPGSVLSSSMGMSAPTLSSHVERGTLTEPDALIRRSSTAEYAWDASESAPALTALGFSAVVPASDDLAAVDLAERAQYVCPARSNGHLGRFDDVGHLGFTRGGRITFHRVTSITRIGYLDPVRWREGVEDRWVPVDTAAELIRDSGLDDGAKRELERAVEARSEFRRNIDGSDNHLALNPLEYAVYTVDPEPVVTGVETDQIVRRFRFTTDTITADTTDVSLASLDDLVDAAAAVD